jgi:hypothetical protein
MSAQETGGEGCSQRIEEINGIIRQLSFTLPDSAQH